jgi:hypothetical protein
MVSKIALFVLSIVGHESVEQILLINFSNSPAAAGVATMRLGFVEEFLTFLHGHARALCLVGIPDSGPATVVSTLWEGFGQYFMIYFARLDGMGGLILDLSLKSPGLLRVNQLL